MISRKPWTYGSQIKNRDYLKREEPFESLVQEFSRALAVVDPKRVRFRMEPKNRKYGAADPLLKRLQCIAPLGRSRSIRFS
jgi:hypothetical protein